MSNLSKLPEFRLVLANYKPSVDVVSALGKIRLVVLTSPTGGGRNTVISNLVSFDGFMFLVSDTTRSPRVNDGVLEQNGGPYWFKSEEHFLKGLKQGKYLAPAIIHNQQVSGVSLEEVRRVAKANKIAITDIEVQGVEDILKSKVDTVTIFLLPPSFEEWMDRLNKRGGMDISERSRRLKSAEFELKKAIDSDHYIFLVNKKVDETVGEIENLMKTRVVNMSVQEENRALAAKLLQEVVKKN